MAGKARETAEKRKRERESGTGEIHSEVDATKNLCYSAASSAFFHSKAATKKSKILRYLAYFLNACRAYNNVDQLVTM